MPCTFGCCIKSYTVYICFDYWLILLTCGSLIDWLIECRPSCTCYYLSEACLILTVNKICFYTCQTDFKTRFNSGYWCHIKNSRLHSNLKNLLVKLQFCIESWWGAIFQGHGMTEVTLLVLQKRYWAVENLMSLLGAWISEAGVGQGIKLSWILPSILILTIGQGLLSKCIMDNEWAISCKRLRALL